MRIKALIKRICQQMLRDKRTLSLIFFAPLLILTLMYFLFNTDSANPKLGAVNINKNLIEAFQKADINVIEFQKSTKEIILDNNLEGMIEADNGKYKLTLQNSDPAKSKVLHMKIGQAINSQIEAKQNMLLGNTKTPNIDTVYIYGNADTVFFDILSPIFVGFFVFFFVFLISGIGLLRERVTGTLERLMSTPIKRWEVITGYLLGFGIFAIIQTSIVVLYAINILDITLAGSIWNVLLINLLLAFVALSLGILLSTFAASEFQMIQFIPIIIVPQVFFAGIFPIEDMAKWLQAIGKIMPIYYGADALKGIMYKGFGLGDIINDIVVLVCYAIIFIILNVFALKRYRKL